jgi:hypothetical protein
VVSADDPRGRRRLNGAGGSAIALTRRRPIWRLRLAHSTMKIGSN